MVAREGSVRAVAALLWRADAAGIFAADNLPEMTAHALAARETA